MADYRLIMSLLLKGRSYREVVAAAGCSHRDVSAAKAAIRVHEITAGRLGVMSEDDLAGCSPMAGRGCRRSTSSRTSRGWRGR
jgi:hypothetical protein